MASRFNKAGSSHEVQNNLPAYADAPPQYDDTLIQIPEQSDRPSEPPKYEEPKLEGFPSEPAPAYEDVVRGEHQSTHLPRLSYADFLPASRRHPDSIQPQYDDFKTLMFIVNDWLTHNAHFRVIRAECIKRKVGKDGLKETETTIYHCSAFGFTDYVLGIRIWLVPNSENSPPQQLWYVNVVPKGHLAVVAPYSCVGMSAGPNAHLFMTPSVYHQHIIYPQFEDLDDVLEKVNENFKNNPLPGDVLNVETVEIKVENMWKPGCVDPENCYWSEKGSSYNLHLHILKIFFVVGEPSDQQIGAMDFVPTCLSKSNSAMGKPRFDDFSNTVNEAAAWMSQQTNIAVKNVQTLEMKMSRSFDSPSGYELNTRSMDYNQGHECVFVRCLRCIYVTNKVSDPPSLSMKMFVPVRVGYREAETMSMTMARLNQWLNCVPNKVVGADTIKFPICAERMSEVQSNQSSYATIKMQGTYWITAIRLYLDGELVEPPVEVYQPPPAVVKSHNSKSCCIS